MKETKKKYLNSEFLSTAVCYCIPETKATINYLEQIETGENDGYKEFSIQVKQTDIYCEKITVPKTINNILINTLIKKLYNKYMDLASNNDKSIKSKLPNHKNNFLTNWIKKDYNFLIEDNDEDSRRLITRIIHTSNNMAVNSRIGPSNFIVISPKLIPILQNSTSFIYSFNNIKEYESITTIGNLMDLCVFVNYDSCSDEILIGRHSSQNNFGGVALLENSINIEDKFITWIGAIDFMSPTSKYMFDTIKVKIVEELPWYKQFVYKILKKRKLI